MSDLTKEQIEANINEWLNRLENGKFSQTRGVLKKRNGSMCCLGVACEVIGVDKEFNGESYTYFNENNRDDLEIPRGEYQKVGLSSPNGSFIVGNTAVSLTALNDGVEGYEQIKALGVKFGKKYTFKEIAAVIRSKPKGLFDDEYDIAPAQS